MIISSLPENNLENHNVIRLYKSDGFTNVVTNSLGLDGERPLKCFIWDLLCNPIQCLKVLPGAKLLVLQLGVKRIF